MHVAPGVAATTTFFEQKRRWLVTGAAGFIGSHVAEALLKLGQEVTGLDNFSTGSAENIDRIRESVTPAQWKQFHFVEGDVCLQDICRRALEGVDIVSHHAALGSIPRSIDHPLAVHGANLTGFIELITAARDEGVEKFMYASSSSVYGDSAVLPRVESSLGSSVSVYAATKRANECYADAYAACYGMRITGLRYFNVYGPRQRIDSAYGTVIPRWIEALRSGGELCIYGDGSTTRDYCYIADAVRANLLAAAWEQPLASHDIFNIAGENRIHLLELLEQLQQSMAGAASAGAVQITHRDFRKGDMLHSYADIGKARALLSYQPEYDIATGLQETVAWYRDAALLRARAG